MRINLVAYLDPGSGSMLIQAIAGGSAAVAVTGRPVLAAVAQIPSDPQARRHRVR
jgi:hypothetical protein